MRVMLSSRTTTSLPPSTSPLAPPSPTSAPWAWRAPAPPRQPLGPLQRHLGDVGVVLDRLVECRRDDFAIDGASHVCDLFGPLTDEQHHEVDVVVVVRDAVGDVLDNERLTGLGRRHDETALAATDGCDEVDHALCQVID